MGWLDVLVEVKTCSVPAAASAARSRFRPMPPRRRAGSTMRSSTKSRPKKWAGLTTANPATEPRSR